MRRPVFPALCLLALASGCAPLQLPFWRDTLGMTRGVTLESLQQDLAFLASSFAAAVTTASDDISDASTSRRVRRSALVWRLEMIPAVQRAAFSDDPRGAYVRTLVLCVLQRRYLESGDGRDLFGEQQGIAVEAATRLEQDAAAFGERFLTPTELRRVVAEANELAQKYPMQGREFSLQRAISGSRELQQSDVFTSVLSIPLAPFRALEGVDSGAQAIREFNVTARHFTDLAAQLPEQLRGELELLLYDFEDRDTVVQGLAAFETLAASADRASLVVEELPEELQSALGGPEGSVSRISATIQQLRDLVVPLEGAAQSLRDASLAWREVIGSRAERDAEPDTGPGFDVREWESAAAAVGDAAGKLRGLAQEAGGLGGTGTGAADALSRAIDRAFWRAATLLALFFVLLIAYRLIAARLARGPER